MSREGPIVLAVPDGASEPLGDAATSLEAAATPALDALAAQGTLRRVATIRDELPAGTEVGLSALLGLDVDAPPARGSLEAAAVGERLEAGEAAWRCDLVPATTPTAETIARVNHAVAPVGARVRALEGHRLLLIGPAAWGDGPPGPHQTSQRLDEVIDGPLADVATAAAEALRRAGVDALAWPWGRSAGRPLASVAAARTVHMAAGSPAAAGLARLTGCALDPVATEDLAPAGVARRIADLGDGDLLVLHDGRADEAGHVGDSRAKRVAIEHFDASVVAPAAEALRAHGGTLVVCPDHGCDPATGAHVAAAVPAVTTELGEPGRPHAHDGGAADQARLTERAVAGLPVTTPHALLRHAAAATRSVVVAS